MAGAGNGQIMVYDIESERRSLAVPGHADDGELLYDHMERLTDYQSMPCASQTSIQPMCWSLVPMTAMSRSGTGGLSRHQRRQVF